MKKLILLFIAMLCSWSIYAWERETIWPKGKMPHRQDHQIAAMTDEAGLSRDEKNELSRRVNMKAIMYNPARIRKVCEHIAKHFKEKIEPNGYKGQVVVYDRECCLMYKAVLDELLGEDATTIVMDTNNDKEDRYKKYRRDRDQESKVLDYFRDPHSPLKLVIVTAKLLTGFDAPPCTYLYIDKVEGLAPGLYRFLAVEHALLPVRLGEDVKEWLQPGFNKLNMYRASAVTFIWAAVLERMEYYFGGRALQYLYLDAGHVCQNLYLAAYTIDTGVCAIGHFNDEEINQLLGLDGENEFVLCSPCRQSKIEGGKYLWGRITRFQYLHL